MSETIKLWLVRIGKILLLAGVVYYLFKDIDFEVVWKSLEGMNQIFVVMAIFLHLLQAFLFGVRWYYITDRACSLKGSIEVVFVAFFVNTFIPAKMGEVSRIFYLKKLYGYPAHKTVSGIFYEKLFDLMFLSFLLMLAAYVFFKDSTVSWVAVAILGSVILFFTTLSRFEEVAWRALHIIPHKAVRVFLKRMLRSLQKKNTFKDFMVTSAFTLAIRLLNFTVVIVLFRYGAQMHLSFEELAVLFVATTVADFLPLAPGGTGVLHAAVVFVLTRYGIDKDTALASAIVYHLIINISPAVVAVMILANKKLSLSSLRSTPA